MFIGAYMSESEPPYPHSAQIGRDVEVCPKEKRRHSAVLRYSGGGTRTPDTRIMIFRLRFGPSVAYCGNVLSNNCLNQCFKSYSST